jgi:hypothetical protein
MPAVVSLRRMMAYKRLRLDEEERRETYMITVAAITVASSISTASFELGHSDHGGRRDGEKEAQRRQGRGGESHAGLAGRGVELVKNTRVVEVVERRRRLYTVRKTYCGPDGGIVFLGAQIAFSHLKRNISDICGHYEQRKVNRPARVLRLYASEHKGMRIRTLNIQIALFKHDLNIPRHLLMRPFCC